MTLRTIVGQQYCSTQNMTGLIKTILLGEGNLPSKYGRLRVKTKIVIGTCRIGKIPIMRLLIV